MNLREIIVTELRKEFPQYVIEWEPDYVLETTRITISRPWGVRDGPIVLLPMSHCTLGHFGQQFVDLADAKRPADELTIKLMRGNRNVYAAFLADPESISGLYAQIRKGFKW